MSSNNEVAIVGGGLAGLAAAQALRTFGLKAKVFEAAPALGEIGAAVNTSPQAVKALRAISVGDGIATEEQSEHIVLIFENGARAEAEYVIGADGVPLGASSGTLWC
jgi:2-polyprenyl-6-methoxyphenol hydroxylase-like FAD-dependent oxidoreductase